MKRTTNEKHSTMDQIRKVSVLDNCLFVCLLGFVILNLYLRKNVEMLLSQILGKGFSEFPNRSRTHDLPEYRLERSND